MKILASKFFGNYDFSDPKGKEVYCQICNTLGLPITQNKSLTVEIPVVSFSEEHIINWFIRNCRRNNSESKRFYIEPDSMRVFINYCEGMLESDIPQPLLNPYLRKSNGELCEYKEEDYLPSFREATNQVKKALAVFDDGECDFYCELD